VESEANREEVDVLKKNVEKGIRGIFKEHKIVTSVVQTRRSEIGSRVQPEKEKSSRANEKERLVLPRKNFADGTASIRLPTRKTAQVESGSLIQAKKSGDGGRHKDQYETLKSKCGKKILNRKHY